LLPNAFTRKSPLTFEATFWLLCNPRLNTMAMEMHHVAEQGLVVKHDGGAVSGSAFSKRCKLISTKALSEGHKWFYERMLATELGRFCGPSRRRILAIDGTSLWATPQIKHLIELDRIRNRTADEPEVTDEEEPCQFRGIVIYDVLNDCIVDISIDLNDIGERRAAIQALRRSVRKGDVLLFDRGYPAAWLVKLIRKLGADCVIRMIRDHKRPEVLAAYSAKDDSTNFIWKVSSQDKTSLKLAGLEYIKDEEIALRCVRGASGKEGVMLLATTLSEVEFNNQEICEFYRQRWGVEIVIGRLKGIRDIEAWSGRTLHRLHLDLWGAVLGDTIESYLARRAQQEVDKAECEREERRANPPQNPPPGRPPKPQGTTRKYHRNKLNRKQFNTMLKPVFIAFMMKPEGEMDAVWQRILRQARRRASWTVIGRSPPRHSTPQGGAAASRRRG
jgi:hypothetical protein